MHKSRRASQKPSSTTQSRKLIKLKQSKLHTQNKLKNSKLPISKLPKLTPKATKRSKSRTIQRFFSTDASNPEIILTTPDNLDDESSKILPHNPEEGIPCNFIELPSTSRHHSAVKPWSIMSFTDNLAKSITFEQMQMQVNFYLEHGGRVLKLYPGYEPYIFESIASQCSMRGINPDDLTLILPVSAHEIKSGMYPHSHPTHPHFFTKQEKISYVREHCPSYVPHRRGYFVHKIIQQLTSKIDNLNLDNTLNLPIEHLYDDYPDNYDPREGGFITTKSGSQLSHNAGTNTTTIRLHDESIIDPMDAFATQELPDGHIFKRARYDNADPIHLPSGRYPADRLRDKVYQVTSHLASENVDLIMINELEHAHQEHISNAYDLILESFFQCELLVLDGKTRGYGLSSRLISTHYNHDHYISPYKVGLIANFCAELARLYKGLPTKDPYFHPQQVRMLMDICTGAVLPPKSVIDDMYGNFKTEFMNKYQKKKSNDDSDVKHTNTPTPESAKSLDEIYSALKQNMESQGMKLDGGNQIDPKNQKKQKIDSLKGFSKMDKMSDFFGNALEPLKLDERLLTESSTSSTSHVLLDHIGDNDRINIDLPQGVAKNGQEQRTSTLNLSLSFLFKGKTPPQTTTNSNNKNAKRTDLSSVPVDIHSYEFEQLSASEKLVKKQFEALDQQLGIVLEAKRLTMLANGSTAEDRLKLQQKQQILLDNYMVLPEDVDVISNETIDKLYVKGSKYTLIDNPDGERGKYKDLLAAKRVLAMKGEGLSEGEIKQLEAAKGKLKKLLAEKGAEGIGDLLSADGLKKLNEAQDEEGNDGFGGDVLKNELYKLQTDEQIDNLLKSELEKKRAEDDIEKSKNIGLQGKKTKSNNNDNDKNDDNVVLESLDSMYDQELFILDDNFSDNDQDGARIDNEGTITTASTSQSSTITPISDSTSVAKKTKVREPIPQEKVEELLNPVAKMSSNEEFHFKQRQKTLELEEISYDVLDNDDDNNSHKNGGDISGNNLYESTIKTVNNKQKSNNALTLTTNFNNFKYYNPYAIINKDKLRSEMLELQLMQSLHKLMPNEDVKALVKGATQYFEKIQQEITISATKRLAIYKLDHFFEQSLLYKERYLEKNKSEKIQAQIDSNSVESLMLKVRPKMIANWEQWKKGERKRQFQQELAMAMEREYGNLFQNIIYKTIIHNHPEFLQERQNMEKNQAENGDENDESSQNLQTAQNSGQIDESIGDIKMPQLKLGQLFKTETFNHLYNLIKAKSGQTIDGKNNQNNKDNQDNEEIEKIKQMYDLLSKDQQDELQRIAMYIPVYTSTGILPLFPANTIRKHHDLRQDLIITEMKRQLTVQTEFISKQKNEQNDKIKKTHKTADDHDEIPGHENENNSPPNTVLGFNKLFDPDYSTVLKNDGLLTQDITWYNDEYVPLWMCNKRQSRLLMLEPEVNLTNYHFTTQRTHPIPTTKSQWKRYKNQQQGIAPLNGEGAEQNEFSQNEKQKLYHLDTNNMTLMTPHQYAIQQGMLISVQNTFDVTVDDKTIRLLDHPTVEVNTQQKLNELLSHSLSFLRTIERSYPYQARDSLAKNLPPILAVSTAQLLQMELPHIITVPELENVLYDRLLPQIQGAVNVLQKHQEFEEFASQLAVAGEKTKSSAEACLLAYNTPIVNTAQRQLAHLHSSLKILEDISMQLLWINLGLGFDSIGLPTATLAGMSTTYLQHVIMKDTDRQGGASSLKSSYLAVHGHHEKTMNWVNDRDVSNLDTLSRQEALQILQTAATQVIPVMKKKLQDLKQHLQATPYSRQQAVALATSERLHLSQTKLREFHMISAAGEGSDVQIDSNGNPIDKKLLANNPIYRQQQQEYELSLQLKDIYKMNPFVPAELALEDKFKIESRSENQLLLLQYNNIHQLNYTKAAQH